MLKNFTTGQWMAILIGILSATAGATAQLTPVFGPGVSGLLVSLANLVMTIFVTPVLFVVTGQNSMVNSVRSMPGVDKVVVNEKATGALAVLAASPDDNKVEATPQAQKAVEAAAKK